jgi:hypothetical protein
LTAGRIDLRLSQTTYRSILSFVIGSLCLTFTIARTPRIPWTMWLSPPLVPVPTIGD